MTNHNVCRYRITLAPRKGRYRLQAIVEGDMQAVVEMGEMNFVRLHSVKVACEWFGDDGASLLICVRVEREELGGTWRDRRWPLPMPASVSDLVFSADGELLTNVIPTWPA